MNVSVTEIRIAPEDIARLREDYAEAYLRERHSSFNSVPARWCNNNDWFRCARTQACVEREIADRAFWGQRIREKELWEYVVVDLIPQHYSANESGTLHSGWNQQCISEDDVTLNKHSGMQIEDDPAPLDNEWNTVRTVIRVIYDPQGTLTADEVRGRIRQEHVELFRVVFDGESQTVIAQETGESENAVNQRISKTRMEVKLMSDALRANPDINPADLAFFQYVKEMPKQDSTRMIREGGYYLFYELNGPQLIRLKARDGAEAEEALQAQYRKTLQNALNRFPRKTRERAREILLDAKDGLEKAAWKLSAALPEFLDKYVTITEAFDKPRIIRQLDPEPDYNPDSQENPASL